MKKVKIKIKILRIKNNLTQEKLASLMNVKQCTISKWENYQTYPHLSQLYQLIKIFNCSLDYLLGLVD